MTIVDDGKGMDHDGLLAAMRLGSRSPVEERAPTDLGRFGLGLKSAAWSQARSLTVFTKSQGHPLLTHRWDLDHVTATGRWSLLADSTETARRNAKPLDGNATGTAVVLERTDRLTGDASRDDNAARDRFFAAITRTADHLSMVFHRFLGGRAPIALSINGVPLVPWDPFLEDQPATQRLPSESIGRGAQGAEITPFVLPHVSKLDPEIHRRAAGTRGWNAQQGFYVYRAKRLLVAGDWLGLRRMQQEEHYKLARIRIDLPNSADALWQIDVRKAAARIPGTLQGPLHRIAQTTRQRAAGAYRFRGKNVARASDRQRSLNFVWERVTRRNGVRSFQVNRRHPVLSSVSDEVSAKRAVETALRLVEENLPTEAIVMEMREHPDEMPDRPFADDSSGVLVMLRNTHAAMVAAGATPAAALRALAVVEPFEAFPEILEAFREELEQ